MEKYRRVLSHDTEKWCKVWQKADSWFQKWHEEFGEFWLEQWKVWKLHFDGLLLSKVYNVWTKKYIGVVLWKMVSKMI